MANYTIEVNFNQEAKPKDANENFSIPNIGDNIIQSQFGVLGKATAIFAGIGIAKKVAETASEVFRWKLSLVERDTGSQDAQDKANAAMSIFNALKNPIDFAWSTFQQVEQSMYDRNIENINLRLLRERGGPSLNRSRREE